MIRKSYVAAGFSDLKTFPANQLLSCTTGARAITSQTVGTILTQDFQREVCEISLTAGFLFGHYLYLTILQDGLRV